MRDVRRGDRFEREPRGHMAKVHHSLILLVSLCLAGCTPDAQTRGDHEDSASSTGDPEPSSALAEPEPSADDERGPVSLASSAVHLSSPTQLTLTVPSCHGRPVVDEILESATEVRLQVITSTGSSDDCLDGVVVSLQDPLGERAVIDDVSDAELPVTGR